MRLETPSLAYETSFFAAMHEFRLEGIPQISATLTKSGFPGYIQRLHDQAVGKNLPEGHIPSREYWMVDGDGFAGRIILGLTYYPAPQRVGHHVGYAVRPSKRRLGYATLALRLLIAEARTLGIHHLMPECHEDNIASRKVIESNGGVLLEPDPDHPQSPDLRFLITVDPDG